MIAISIIIPIHNAEETLDCCLRSVVNQTFTRWECLLINDGSSDNSGIICEKWYKKDNRFIVVHQMNQGVSLARNRGLDMNLRDFVCFVDADDYLEPNFLEKMYMARVGADFVVSGQIREYGEGNRSVLVPSINGCFALAADNTGFFIDLEKKFLLFAPHEKLYKATIIQDYKIRFPEGCDYGEDLIFNYEYLNHIQTISTIPEALYHYNITNSGLSAAFRPNQFEQDYSQWRIVRDFHKKRGLWNDDVEKYLYQRLWGIVYDGIFLYPKLVNPPRDYLSRILSIPEICDLKRHQDSFSCARWIKWFILFRLDIAFVQYFKLKKS